MLNQWPILLIFVVLLSACTEADFNIPDRGSIGMSQPLIEIYSPLSGSTLAADTEFVLDYAILRSEDGHHIKIYVDKKRPMSVFKLRGKHRMKGLPTGDHRIRIIEYTKDGRKTGGNITLQVTMLNPFPNSPGFLTTPHTRHATLPVPRVFFPFEFSSNPVAAHHIDAID